MLMALLADRDLRKPKSVIPLATIVVLTAGVMLLLNVGDAAQFGRLGHLSAAQNQPRVAVWTYALSAFKESPLIGNGYAVGSGVLAIAIHSVPLRVLASYGLLGMVPYVGVIGGAVYVLIRGTRLGEGPQAIVCCAGLGMVTIALLDASTHSSGLLFLDVPQPALLGLCLGQAGSVLWRRRRHPAAPDRCVVELNGLYGNVEAVQRVTL
jgi:O-antigen ligase